MFEDITKDTVITREQKAMLYVIKTLNELVDMGIMEGKPFEVTEVGLEHIKDFEPTDEEMKIAVLSLKALGHIQ